MYNMHEAPRSLAPELRPKLQAEMLQVYAMARGSQDDDRTLAIVTTACLEALLTEVIAVRLPVLDEDVRRTLFDQQRNAPLSSYAAKVHMARAMNAVAGIAYDDLKHVGRIRNLFAHHVRITSFDDAEVVPHIRKLQMQARNAQLFRDMTEIAEGMPEVDYSNRGIFADSVASLNNGLFNCAITDAGFGASCLL